MELKHPRVANVSDGDRERIRSILERAIARDREARNLGPEATARPKSVGVYYEDPPGVCIPVGD